MKFPERWQRGQGIKGPDYILCSNTDQRPFIIKSSYSGKFFVGPYAGVIYALGLPEIHDRNGECNTPKGYVFVYSNKSNAISLFKTLCESIENFNKDQKKNIKRIKEKAYSHLSKNDRKDVSREYKSLKTEYESFCHSNQFTYSLETWE